VKRVSDPAPEATWTFSVHGMGDPAGAAKWANSLLDNLAESGYQVTAAVFAPVRKPGKRVVRRPS